TTSASPTSSSARAAYTEGDREETGIPQEVAVAVMREKYEVVAAMFHGFDYARSFGGPPSERLAVIPAAMEHILQQPDGKKRFMQAVAELAKAFALAIPHERALAIRDDVGFVQTVRAAFAKATPADGKAQEEY